MFANETSGAVRSYPPSYSTFTMTSPTQRATSPLVRTRAPTTATPIGAPQVLVPSPEELASTVWPEAEPYPLANASTFQEQIGELRNKMWDSDRFILSAPPAIWADISEKYGETMDCNLFERLEYINGLIINIGIPETTNEPVPDGAVARKPSNGVGLAQYLMVFEWAATQSEVSLDEKARKWFQIPSVQVVITINVETSPWNRPSAKPKSPTLTYEQFCEKADASALGPVVLGGHTFYHEDGEKEYCRKSYLLISLQDITPGKLTNALLDRFEKATGALILATSLVIGADTFKHCFTKQNPFDLAWDTFPALLTKAMKQDVHKHYVKWNNRVFLGPKSDVPKRKAGDRDSEESDGDNDRKFLDEVQHKHPRM
ncbi:hypothetical protein B0H14DRAFT_2609940 [Mycena olivaceomarginata]|nr:hypothetical protein B0H14DRAFT_2609940 [Mycena olivaceomarginata]